LPSTSISITVFESEPSASSRSQGGTLDIHTESGQRLIKAAGLLDAFKKIARPEGDVMKIADKHGVLHLDEAGEEAPRLSGKGPQDLGDRPEVDRRALRAMLIESIPAEIIKWGSKVAKVVSGDTGYTVVLADGKDSEVFDLVVGADGAWSRVRPLLTAETPFYAGVVSVEFHIHDVDSRFPDIARRVGAGTLAVLSDSRGLFAQRQGDGSVRTYAMFRASGEWLDEKAYDFSKDKQRFADDLFPGWSERDRELVLKANEDSVVLRRLHMLPRGHRWEHQPGLTLLGDAAHVMLPFGEGVNDALLDALQLGEQLIEAVKEKQDLSKAITAYEEGMFERAKEHVEES
ncbi:FAD binding domain protein, partial [Cylindrobasidium torrendii FP15055 ss-10]